MHNARKILRIIIVAIADLMRSNCLIFALVKWRKYGGYLVIRKSRYGWWPHFIWCRDLKNADIEHLQPVNAGNENPYVKKFLFEGKISKED